MYNYNVNILHEIDYMNKHDYIILYILFIFFYQKVKNISSECNSTFVQSKSMFFYILKNIQ